MMVTRAEVRTEQSVPKPRMRLMGVSVTIVVGARESRAQGAGSHRGRWAKSPLHRWCPVRHQQRGSPLMSGERKMP
jgi:hypothetical protein